VGAPAEAAELGRALARELLELGAQELLAAEPGTAEPDLARAGDNTTPVGTSTAAAEPSAAAAGTSTATDFTEPSPMENNR
jgi:hydroxymethylbilane synthase